MLQMPEPNKAWCTCLLPELLAVHRFYTPRVKALPKKLFVRLPSNMCLFLTQISAALGYPDCILFRPGFLAEAQREKSRALESIFGVRRIAVEMY